MGKTAASVKIQIVLTPEIARALDERARHGQSTRSGTARQLISRALANAEART